MDHEQLTTAISAHLAQLTATLAVAATQVSERRRERLPRELVALHQRVKREEKILIARFGLPAANAPNQIRQAAGARDTQQTPLTHVVRLLRDAQELARSLEGYFKFFGLPPVSRFYYQLRLELYRCEHGFTALAGTPLYPPTGQGAARPNRGGRPSVVAAALNSCPLYFVLDESLCAARDPVETGQQALRAGVRIMQLRFKALPAHELLALARELRPACDAHQCLLIVNDRVDVAMLAGADGVHLGAADLQPGDGRALGAELIIGATARTAEAAAAAQSAGADYIGAGSVFGSMTKPGLPVIGPAGIRSIVEAIDIPVVAIGGVTADNCAEALATGASGFASVNPFTADEPVEGVVRKMREVCGGAAAHSQG